LIDHRKELARENWGKGTLIEALNY